MTEAAEDCSTRAPHSAGDHLLFPRELYHARFAAVQADLAAAGVDFAIYDEIEAVQWLTGFGGAMNIYRCCVVPTSGDPFFVIRALDESPFRQASWLDQVETFDDWEAPEAALLRAVEKRGLKTGRIGIDMNSYAMPVGLQTRIAALFGDAEFQDIGEIVTDRRMIKHPLEIALLRKSSRANDTAMLAAFRAAREGAKLRDVMIAANGAYLAQGADPFWIGPITRGEGVDFLHGHLHPEPLKRGDICHIELLPRFSGYNARLMRPIVIGTASERQRSVAERLLALQDAQFAAMKPGALASDVDAVVRRAIVSEGLRRDFTGISGYTVGFNGGAAPRTSDFNRVFTPAARWILSEGMTFHMYLVADGIAFSETILVTRDGAERLSTIPRVLFESDTWRE